MYILFSLYPKDVLTILCTLSVGSPIISAGYIPTVRQAASASKTSTNRPERPGTSFCCTIFRQTKICWGFPSPYFFTEELSKQICYFWGFQTVFKSGKYKNLLIFVNEGDIFLKRNINLNFFWTKLIYFTNILLCLPASRTYLATWQALLKIIWTRRMFPPYLHFCAVNPI